METEGENKMSGARDIKEITQKDFQDYLKKLIENYELEIEKIVAKIDVLHDLLWELDGYKIVEEKK